MKTLMLSAFALALGISAASAQGMPQGLLSPELGASWAAKQRAADHAARDRAPAAEHAAMPARTAETSSRNTVKN